MRHGYRFKVSLPDAEEHGSVTSTSTCVDLSGEPHRFPISVDVPTLRTIIAPIVIRSSRFFADTRMQPLQLVVFVQ
jgi:hypothetical protein